MQRARRRRQGREASRSELRRLRIVPAAPGAGIPSPPCRQAVRKSCRQGVSSRETRHTSSRPLARRSDKADPSSPPSGTHRWGQSSFRLAGMGSAGAAGEPRVRSEPCRFGRAAPAVEMLRRNGPAIRVGEDEAPRVYVSLLHEETEGSRGRGRSPMRRRPARAAALFTALRTDPRCFSDSRSRPH